MASVIALRINTVKGQPEQQIEGFVAELASRLAAHDPLARELRGLLEPAGVRLKRDREEFLFGVVLSCVLADIGTEVAHPAKTADISKIGSICARRGLQYSELVRASTYADVVLRTIDDYGDDD